MGYVKKSKYILQQTVFKQNHAVEKTILSLYFSVVLISPTTFKYLINQDNFKNPYLFT